MALKVYDTLRARKEEFEPVNPGKVGIYFCGMTVQDRPHIGHMLAFVAGDMIRRHLRFKGYEVTYIQNFTDIDDKIIAKANEEGVDYRVIAERNMKEYFRYADELNILKADVYPLATQHIADIVALIGALVEKGFAYDAGGDVYFRVRAFPQYGRLSKRNVDELQSGARIEVGERKEDPLDFALWKGAKEGEPAWESPWGPGRPGWHIECSAMSMKYLGTTIDMHGGGQDLIFPHHENEIAQSEAATGKPYHPVLDAQRSPEPPRREDVEVDGAFLRDRGHQPRVHGRGDPVLSPFDPFPQRHRVQPRAAEGGRGGPRAHPERVRLRRRAALGAARRGPAAGDERDGEARRARRGREEGFRRGDGRRFQQRRGDRARLPARPRDQPHPRRRGRRPRPARRRPSRSCARRSRYSIPFSASSREGSRRPGSRFRARSRSSSPSGSAPGRRRDGRMPTRCGRRSPSSGSSSRTGRRGRSSSRRNRRKRKEPPR